MWDPRRLTTLQASTVCYRDSFTLSWGLPWKDFRNPCKLSVTTSRLLDEILIRGISRSKETVTKTSAVSRLVVCNRLQKVYMSECQDEGGGRIELTQDRVKIFGFHK
jgi:hypothetical protein